jgi:flagellar M-ring protein FliF
MNQNLLLLGKQLREIWNQLGASQRISVVVAAVIVFGGLGGLAFWSGRADYGLLYGKLDDTEAGKVIQALTDAKIPYRLGQGGSSIYVPHDKVHVMRMQLASRGIPRGEGVGFEIFDKPNSGISDFVQRANFLRAVQGELARTIGEINEVEAARVMIVMPENRLLVDEKKHPTASVFVRVKGNTQLQPQSVNSIRFLVANSVEGLSANFVTVVDNHGNVLSANNDNDSVVGLTTSQLDARRNLEQYLSKKAEGMLEKVLGPGQAVVRVAADINFDTVTRTEEKFDPEAQVVRSSTVNDENNDSTTSGNNANAVGVAAALNAETNTVAGGPVSNSRLKRKQTTSQYEINRTLSNIMQSAGGLKRVSAAVFVAAKVEGTGAARKVTPRTPEELEKLRRIVQSSLGIQLGTDAVRRDEITLEEMPFNDQFNVEMTQQVEKQQKHQLWWEVGKNVLYVGLALGILFVFWRSVKQAPVEQIPIGIPLRQFATNGHANGNGKVHSNGKAQLAASSAGTPGVVTVDVLNQLIRENPENMAHAIRTWLGQGSQNQK